MKPLSLPALKMSYIFAKHIDDVLTFKRPPWRGHKLGKNILDKHSIACRVHLLLSRTHVFFAVLYPAVDVTQA